MYLVLAIEETKAGGLLESGIAGQHGQHSNNNPSQKKKGQCNYRGPFKRETGSST
jgi:hypothetical protein